VYGCVRCVKYDISGLIDALTASDLGYHKIRCVQTSKFKNPVIDELSSSGQTIIDTVWVDMPPYENTTTGTWFDVSKEALDFLGGGAAAAIHAAAHAFLNQFPMAGDLRTECPVPEKENMKKESSRKRPGRYVLQL
jgi:hypothetical protein